MSMITVFHNPECSNSRGALALIRERGFEPRVVEYLVTPLGARLCRPPERVLDILPPG